jgi:hypothetical protein
MAKRAILLIPLEQVWIAYEEGNEEALRDLVRRFCATLGQEAMYRVHRIGH